jgi:hypothetical protein
VAGAETQPNKNISRREVLKKLGRGGLIVGGTALGVVSGIDLYSVYKNENGYADEAENAPRKIRDVWGVDVGVGLTLAGEAMVWVARQGRNEIKHITNKSKPKPLLPSDTVK